MAQRASRRPPVRFEEWARRQVSRRPQRFVEQAQAQEQSEISLSSEQVPTGAEGRTSTEAGNAAWSGPGHWLAGVHPTPGPPVRAPASQPSPAEALALVSSVAAWATNAQLAANLAVQSASPASACTAHAALVAVGRALATALAAYGHGHVARHLELADERLSSQEGARAEALVEELEHVEDEVCDGSDSDSGSGCAVAVTPLHKRRRQGNP